MRGKQDAKDVRTHKVLCDLPKFSQNPCARYDSRQDQCGGPCKLAQGGLERDLLREIADSLISSHVEFCPDSDTLLMISCGSQLSLVWVIVG